MLAKTEGFYIPSANMLKGVSCDIFGAFISILHQTEQQKNTCPKLPNKEAVCFKQKNPDIEVTSSKMLNRSVNVDAQAWP